MVFRDLCFDCKRNIICPITRWFFSCEWRGDFKDLKQHLVDNHEIIHLKGKAIVLTKTMFYVINRGFMVNDDVGEVYFAYVSYYVDKMLYVRVISLKNRLEVRGYKVSLMGQYYFGEVGEGNYVKIPGICDYFTENQVLQIFIELL